MASRASATNCHVNCEVSIMLHSQPSSTCYTALRIKKCSKSTFAAIKVATMKNTDNFCFEGKLPHEESIVCTVVFQKACVQLKQHRMVKNQAHSLIRYRVTLV